MATTKTARRDTYLKLVRKFPLVQIRTVEEVREASRFLNNLMAAGELDDGEQAYADTLTVLIERYQDDNVKLPQLPPCSTLKFLMEQHGMSQPQVAVRSGLLKSSLSEMLNGK